MAVTLIQIKEQFSTPIQLLGKDGPVNIEFWAQSGFYICKWLDPTVGSGRRGRGSDGFYTLPFC